MYANIVQAGSEVLQVVEGDVRILHGVVKKRRAYGVGIHAIIQQDSRHRQRLRDIRVAGGALLPLVCLISDHVRLGYLFKVVGLLARLYLLHQLVECLYRRTGHTVHS